MTLEDTAATAEEAEAPAFEAEEGVPVPKKKKSLRDRILGANDITKELVEVPEWDAIIEVRSMNGKERSEVMQTAIVGDEIDFELLFPLVLIHSCYDPETGERVFEPADRDTLNTKNSGHLETVSKVAMRLSGLGREGVKTAKGN